MNFLGWIELKDTEYIVLFEGRPHLPIGNKFIVQEYAHHEKQEGHRHILNREEFKKFLSDHNIQHKDLAEPIREIIEGD